MHEPQPERGEPGRLAGSLAKRERVAGMSCRLTSWGLGWDWAPPCAQRRADPGLPVGRGQPAQPALCCPLQALWGRRVQQPDGSTVYEVQPQLQLCEGEAAQVALQVAKTCASMAGMVRGAQGF
jgi:hypothetical protein